MDDFLADDEIVAGGGGQELTQFDRPDFIGVVSGASYKLDNADGVTEYALTIFLGGDAYLFEASDVDLRYLARQITALVGE